MPSVPSESHFEVLPTWMGLFVMIAVGLAIVSFVVVMSVLLLAGVNVVSSRKIRSLGAMMLFIVPALAVVGMIGMKWGTARVHTYRYPPPEVQQNRQPSKTESASVQDARRGSGKMVKSVSRVDDGKTKSAVNVEVEDAPDEPNRRVDRNGAHQTVGVPVAAELETSVPARPLAGVLRVRGTASAPPEWAGKEPVPSGDGVLVSLSSQRFATIGEAEENATALAVDYLKKFYRDEYPLRGEWTVPVTVIEQSGLNSLVGEVFDKDFGNGVTGKMYRAHLRLDVGPKLREAVHASWHDQVVAQRLTEIGGVFGLATLMLATFAGYFRLDSLTAGQYRRRLKLAAASLIAAGSLVAWQVLA